MRRVRDDVAQVEQIEGTLVGDHGHVLPGGEPGSADRLIWVPQVLGLLELAPEGVHAIAALGALLPRPIVSERMLRPLLTLPAGEQQRALAGVCPTANPASA